MRRFITCSLLVLLGSHATAQVTAAPDKAAKAAKAIKAAPAASATTTGSAGTGGATNAGGSGGGVGSDKGTSGQQIGPKKPPKCPEDGAALCPKVKAVGQ
ncbi:MAG: hypothetical protein EOP35_01555 [Rubrivivax sp.]|nr:MAG: hypothetical protein EOP35_01555 [Rubrivivax sp.]